jgi:hypothetical protein
MRLSAAQLSALLEGSRHGGADAAGLMIYLRRAPTEGKTSEPWHENDGYF